jgi:lipopolysaccharide transport system permease protein
MSSPPVAVRKFVGPSYLAGSLTANIGIVRQMAKREIIDRYRGSVLGLLWSFFNPVAMLLIYTFVFSIVLGARWPGSGGGSVDYALNLFAGMTVFSLFAESVTRAPGLVVQNGNLVKKVVFPLEVLPWVGLSSSAFHAGVNYLVLLAFVVVAKGDFHATALLFPLVVVPVMLFALGLSWFLSSLGVFLRDMTHTVGLLVTALMFVSPVFYPLSAAPEAAQRVLRLNPLARSIDDVRAIVLQGTLPDVTTFVVLCVASAVVAWAGLAWFMRTKHAFADVL